MTKTTALVTGVAGALLLSGCTGGGEGGADDRATPRASTSAGASAGAGASSGVGAGASSGASASPSGSPSVADELEGSWLATTGGKAVALVVTGKQAALFATGGTVCSGTAGRTDAVRTIRLSCTDGSGAAAGADDRTAGTVESVDGSTLKVDWAGGPGTETYTRAEGGRMPSGLPTEGLGG